MRRKSDNLDSKVYTFSFSLTWLTDGEEELFRAILKGEKDPAIESEYQIKNLWLNFQVPWERV